MKQEVQIDNIHTAIRQLARDIAILNSRIINLQTRIMTLEEDNTRYW